MKYKIFIVKEIPIFKEHLRYFTINNIVRLLAYDPKIISTKLIIYYSLYNSARLQVRFRVFPTQNYPNFYKNPEKE